MNHTVDITNYIKDINDINDPYRFMRYLEMLGWCEVTFGKNNFDLYSSYRQVGQPADWFVTMYNTEDLMMFKLRFAI